MGQSIEEERDAPHTQACGLFACLAGWVSDTLARMGAMMGSLCPLANNTVFFLLLGHGNIPVPWFLHPWAPTPAFWPTSVFTNCKSTKYCDALFHHAVTRIVD